MMKQHEAINAAPIKRIEYANKLLIFDPIVKGMIECMEDCRERSRISIEAKCLFITGITGSGKTTLANHMKMIHPKNVSREGTTVPVLVSKIMTPTTPKSMVTKLLESIGDPLPDKGTQTSQTLRLYHLLEQCRVELIVVDEFQHLYDRESNKVLIEASTWLKDLVTDTKIPIVLLGMPWGARVLDMCTQLKRRFAAHKELKPFEWVTPEGQQYFMKFLNVIDKKLPFEQRSELAEEEVAFRFMCASRGKKSTVMDIIRRAAEYSIRRKMQKITIDMLEKAYDSEVGTLYKGGINPFRVHHAKLKYVPITPDDEEYKMPSKEKNVWKKVACF